MPPGRRQVLENVRGGGAAGAGGGGGAPARSAGGGGHPPDVGAACEGRAHARGPLVHPPQAGHPGPGQRQALLGDQLRDGRRGGAHGRASAGGALGRPHRPPRAHGRAARARGQVPGPVLAEAQRDPQGAADDPGEGRSASDGACRGGGARGSGGAFGWSGGL